MKDSEREAAAKAFRESHGLQDRRNQTSSDHPSVEVMRVLLENAQLLADDKNQAFTQLYLGKFRNLFTDETKDFALAYEFALHPLDEVQRELKELEIFETVRRKEKIDAIETEIIEEKDISFEVSILKEFIDEWMRKRVPANRLRVEEFIRMNNNTMIREAIQTSQQPQRQEIPRGRII